MIIFDAKTIPSESFQSDLAPVSRFILNRQTISNALQNAQNDPRLVMAQFTRDSLVLDVELKSAAVLVLLIERETGRGDEVDFEVLLSVRAQHLRHHAGQVSFVGGRLDDGETFVDAALREAFEEVGLKVHRSHVLGALPAYQTVTGFLVTPIVAVMSALEWSAQSLSLEAAEVESVFTVPLPFLLAAENCRVHHLEMDGNRREFYSVTYQDYFIWGASMGMLRQFDAILRASVEFF